MPAGRDAYAVVPDALRLVLATGPLPPQTFGRTSWISSDQTRIAFAFSDGRLRETGKFTWPNAHDWVDNHLVHLVRVAEAGLVRGCAPAKLPPSAELRSAPDASPEHLRADHAELERRLEGLRGSACAGAK